jgi:hypothetical protein
MKNTTKNTIKFKDIKTPKTVEEFRDNLKKYYCKDGDKRLMNSVGETVIIDELESMEDLYKVGNEDWEWNGSDHDHPPFSLTPSIVLEKQNKDKTKYLKENEILWNFEGLITPIETVCKEFWENEDNFTIFENDQSSFIQHQANLHDSVYWYPYWKDNTLMREYYQKTLGEYGCYGEYGKEVN